MIIADTGFWGAFMDRKDDFHATACQFVINLQEGLITTLPVATETCYLLQKRVGQRQAVAFLNRHSVGAYSLFNLDDRHFSRLTELMLQYEGLPMDLADASLVILAEYLGHGRIVATDRRDFNGYRWKNRHPFTNLLDVS